MSEVLRYSFPEGSDRAEVEHDVALAVFVAECIYGRPQTRLDVSYYLPGSGRRCALAVHGPAGESVARVFTGLCGERFGEGGFTVERECMGFAS